MTKNELIAQFKQENTKVISILNGVEVELSAAEYEANAIAWAEMRYQQMQKELEKTQRAVDKAELLIRLGITADEAALLLS